MGNRILREFPNNGSFGEFYPHFFGRFRFYVILKPMIMKSRPSGIQGHHPRSEKILQDRVVRKKQPHPIRGIAHVFFNKGGGYDAVREDTAKGRGWRRFEIICK